jgi:hypothetical protein
MFLFRTVPVPGKKNLVPRAQRKRKPNNGVHRDFFEVSWRHALRPFYLSLHPEGGAQMTLRGKVIMQAA